MSIIWIFVSARGVIGNSLMPGLGLVYLGSNVETEIQIINCFKGTCKGWLAGNSCEMESSTPKKLHCHPKPNQTKLTKMGSDPFSNHISIYRIVPDNRLHVTQSLLEAKAIIMEKNHSFFGDWRLQTDHFKITWPLINLISNLVRKNTLWRQNYERIWSQKVLCAWLKSSKLCNQVPSLSLSRWRTLTLLKI